MKLFMKLYQAPGKRALAGLILFIAGGALSVPLMPVGIAIGLFGFLLLTSFLGKKKAFFVGNFGTVSVVRVEEYSYPPLFFFMWPFYYKPHRVRHFQLNHLPPVTLEPGAPVGLFFLFSRLAEAEELTPERLAALQEHPATENETAARRAEFERQAARFKEAGLLKPLVENDFFSVYALPDECYALFTYRQAEGGPLGLLIRENGSRLLAESPERLTEILLKLAPTNDFFVLDDRRFEVLQRMESTEGVEHNVGNEIANKAELSRATLEGHLRGTYVLGKKTSGILLLVFGGLSAELGIAGLFFMPPMGIAFLAVGILLILAGVKKLRSIKGFRAQIEAGEYYVVSVKAEGKLAEDDSEGTEYYLQLENGTKFPVAFPQYREAEAGDSVYFLWLEGQDRHCAGFLRREYYLAKDAKALLRPLAFTDKT